jgi:hypothetical protein
MEAKEGEIYLEIGQPTSEAKPAISLAFYNNFGENADIIYPITKERMQTVIDDLAATNDAFIHANSDGTASSFAAFKTYLTGLKTEENSENQVVSVDYHFANDHSDGETVWAFSYEDKEIDASQEHAMKSNKNFAPMASQDNETTPHLLNTGNIIALDKKPQELSSVFMSVALDTGIKGRVVHEFKDVSAKDADAFAQRLRVCGHNKTAINDNKTKKTLLAAAPK